MRFTAIILPVAISISGAALPVCRFSASSRALRISIPADSDVATEEPVGLAEEDDAILVEKNQAPSSFWLKTAPNNLKLEVLFFSLPPLFCKR